MNVFIISVIISVKRVRVRAMVFNATFNNISVISLLVKETGVPGENH